MQAAKLTGAHRIAACHRTVASRPARAARPAASFFGNTSIDLGRVNKYRIYAEEVSATVDEDGKLMSMASSLIERAEEVANTGFVDPAFQEKYVDELKAELAELEARALQAEANAAAIEENTKGLKEQYVRLSADFDNFRKRSASERDSLKLSVKGDTVSTMLPLIDNFELAKSQLKLETEGEKKIDAAYQGLYKQMVELFRGLGLEAVPGAGEPFDPEVHEAIMREPNEDVPDGTVLEEFRKGFKLGDRLLRPAMVKVSFSDAPAPVSSEEDSAAEESGSE